MAGDNWQPVYEMVSDHRVARFLRARGYDLVQFGGWWRGTYDNPLADENRRVQIVNTGSATVAESKPQAAPEQDAAPAEEAPPGDAPPGDAPPPE